MRHKKVVKRVLAADTIHNSVIVAQLINYIMRDGKKSIAEKQIYGMLALIVKQDKNPLETLDKALQNVGPRVEVKGRRVGGANYQVPIEVKADRRNTLAIRWIIEASRKRSNKEFHTYAEKLAAEIIAASKNEGEAMRKKELTMRQAEANRAFAHFRF
jgi:small subunit ribosomal protein S7